MLSALLMSVCAATDAGITMQEAANTTAWSDSLDALVHEAAGQRVVLLGETHRMVEPHALLRELLARLVKEAGYTHLAFEGQEDRQVVVDQFFAGAREEAALRDTLLNPGLQSALPLAKRLGVRVLMIDGPAAWNVDTLEQTRDQRMLKHLRDVLDSQPSAKVLVITGNSHVVKNVELEVMAEGAGHVADAHRVRAYRLGHLLNLYTGGHVLSVRTVDPGDLLGKARRACSRVGLACRRRSPARPSRSSETRSTQAAS